MMRARCLALVGPLIGGSVVLACGDSERSLLGSEGGSIPRSDAGIDGAPNGTIPPRPPTGIVVAHAASFPSFRLCFEAYPELRPQPDSKIMPNANVVGVEVGSVVRMPPLPKAPGKVYVIDRRVVEASVGDDELPCGALICDPEEGQSDGRCLRRRQDYDVIAAIDRPLGTEHVDLVAIAGCANGIVLENIGVPSSVCGDGWTFESGNLGAHALALPAEPSPLDADGSPLLFVHLSPILALQQGGGSEFDVTFGRVDEARQGLDAERVVATKPPLFAVAPPTMHVPHGEDQAFYGMHGFRVVVRGEDGGAATLVEQSLAEIQDLASPRDVPTEYYRATTSYALLLLGDPSVTPTLADGGANAKYNVRRGLHLLAVPIADPDGGAPRDASAPTGPER